MNPGASCYSGLGRARLLWPAYVAGALALWHFAAGLVLGQPLDTTASSDFAYVVASSLSITGWGAQVVTNGSNIGSPSGSVDFGQVVTANYVWAGTNAAFFSAPLDGASVTAEIADLVNAADTVAVACGEFHTLLLKRDGSLAARGWNGVGQTTIPPGLTNVVAIGCGSDHSLAVLKDGGVAAWGSNGYGQCTVPDDATNIVAIAGGARHTAALAADGHILCWGANESGQCDVPDGATNAIAVVCGGFHTLALLSNHTVFAWGNDGQRQIEAPPGLTNVIAIAAGGQFSLALRSDGAVVGWGDASHGQSLPPLDLTNAVAIAAGDYHAIALRRDGTVAAWGDNTFQSTETPSGLTNVAAIAAGGYHNETIVQTLPYLSAPRWTTNGFEMDLNMVLNTQYSLETSTNLVGWSVYSNGIAIPGAMRLTMPVAAPKQFYRARISNGQ